MSFSVTCSNCDRRFVDIDDSLIGQQARCRCGSIVELAPGLGTKKSKTKRRPAGENRPATSANPAKARPAKASNRSSTSAPAAKSPKPGPDVNPAPAPRRKKRRLEQPQPAAAHAVESNSAQTKTETKSETKAKSSDSALQDSYADLDQILAGGVDVTPLEPTRVDSPFAQPAAEIATRDHASRQNNKGLIGAGIGGLAGLLAAFVLLVTRASAFGGTPFGWTGQAFYGTYTASYGTGEMTNASANLFTGLGWWILLLAVLMGIASGLSLVRVAIQMTAGRKTLAWSRGLLATLSVVCLFSLMGMLFVQNIHHGNLIRDLNSFSSSAPIEGLIEPDGGVETFQDIRENYESESTDFMIGVLTFAVLPLVSFGGVAASLLSDER